MGPNDSSGGYGLPASFYSKLFLRKNITRVIRLNLPLYEKSEFEKEGIVHNDLFFQDGTTPSSKIVERFMKTCQKHFADPKAGAIGIHCKAGLGRTGTLIGLYCMENYKISGEAFIGWCRIARPGSVLGPQQNYLVRKIPAGIPIES